MSPRRCANCGDTHRADEVCAVHWEARLTGHEDQQVGVPEHQTEWPSGHYGHADYWIGYHGGKPKPG